MPPLTDDGSVVVESGQHSDEEAAIDAFLAFISDDIKRRPGAVTPMSDAEAARLDVLLEGVEADLDDDFAGATPI